MIFKNDLSKKVYDLMISEGVVQEDIINNLILVYKDLNDNLWENVNISLNVLFTIKDIVFYNLEHLPNGGEITGISNMKNYGKYYPNFLNCFNDTQFLNAGKVKPLLVEIEDILSKWNKNLKYAELRSDNVYYGDSMCDLGIIIYDSVTEKPFKYGYNKNYGSIVDVNGNKIKKHNDQTILCALSGEIGEYSNFTIMYNFLIELRQVCRLALVNNKGIKIELN